MDLAKCEVRPGVVLKVVNKYGVVKASACGYFSEEDDPDLLPPISQFIRISPNSYSEPHEGDAIWVWINKENPQELFYTFQGDASITNGEVLDQEYEDCEILSSRNGGESTIQYNNEDGWKINNGSTAMTVGIDDNISLIQNDRKHVVDITDDGFKFITNGGTQEPAVLGTKLTECLQEFVKCLQKAAAAGKSNPHTAPMAVSLESSLIAVNQKINKILSKNMTLD